MAFATGAEKYHAEFERLGATPLPREHSEWLGHVRGSMDIVMDGVCADDFESSWAATRPGGLFIGCGYSVPASRGSGPLRPFIKANVWLNARQVVTFGQKRKRSTFYAISGTKKKAGRQQFKDDWAALVKLLQAGSIAPQIVKTVGLAEVAEVLMGYISGKVSGKVIVDPWKELPEGAP